MLICIELSKKGAIFIFKTKKRIDKAVFIYMNNMSLHFNDFEEKSLKNAFFGLKYKYCYAKLLKPGV